MNWVLGYFDYGYLQYYDGRRGRYGPLASATRMDVPVPEQVNPELFHDGRDVCEGLVE